MGRPQVNALGKVTKAARQQVERPFASAASVKQKSQEAKQKTKDEKRRERSEAFLDKLAKAKAQQAIDSTAGKLNLDDLAQSLEGMTGDKASLLAVLAADKARSRIPTAKQSKQSKPLSQKQKVHIMQKETNQLGAVMSHPAIQQDPFGTLHLHLQNTIRAQQQAQQQLKQASKLEQKSQTHPQQQKPTQRPTKARSKSSKLTTLLA